MSQRGLVGFSIAVVAVILIAAIGYYFVGPEHRRVQTASESPVVGKVQVGMPAPAFEVASTAGLFDLSKTQKPVFLEIFATWCPHCQHEVVVIDKLYRAYGSQVQFLGVSGSNTAMDGTSPASELDVLDWAKRFDVRYPVAYDPLLNVANLYLQGGFPTFVVVAKDKRVAYLGSGEVAYGELSAAVAKVLR
jgi:cytochrome c biogenesis protein CcmG, thiol:disulfide interchange protein DsbE